MFSLSLEINTDRDTWTIGRLCILFQHLILHLGMHWRLHHKLVIFISDKLA